MERKLDWYISKQCLWCVGSSVWHYHSVCLFSVKVYLEEHHPDRVSEFMAGAPAALKKILGQIKDFQVAKQSWRIVSHPV